LLRVAPPPSPPKLKGKWSVMLSRLLDCKLRAKQRPKKNEGYPLRTRLAPETMCLS